MSRKSNAPLLRHPPAPAPTLRLHAGPCVYNGRMTPGVTVVASQRFVSEPRVGVSATCAFAADDRSGAAHCTLPQRTAPPRSALSPPRSAPSPPRSAPSPPRSALHPPAAHCHLPAAHCRPPAARRHLPAAPCRPPAARCTLPQRTATLPQRTVTLPQPAVTLPQRALTRCRAAHAAPHPCAHAPPSP